jgi:predicted SAM-dependent methyltransferase
LPRAEYLRRVDKTVNSTKLNLGCGGRYRDGWVNVNFTSTGPGVISANLEKGIPFPDNSFEVVYHSHVLEHFTKYATVDFLKECHRVLKHGGVIRAVVPDLEAIARNYVAALEKARAGIEGWDHNYDWMMLEMYDQVVRNQSGGEMARYLFNETIPNEQFVIDRCGMEVRNLIEAGRKGRNNAQAVIQPAPSKVGAVIGLLREPHRWKESLLRLLLGNEHEALQIGRFRLSGENHQWMYDNYSLGKLLTECGFIKVITRNAKESYLSDWSSYNLDTEPNGSVYKPDSLFMEAIKP